MVWSAVDLEVRKERKNSTFIPKPWLERLSSIRGGGRSGEASVIEALLPASSSVCPTGMNLTLCTYNQPNEASTPAL
jgi:hypothetical protein